MNLQKAIFYFTIYFFSVAVLSAQQINVGLWREKPVEAFTIYITENSFLLTVDGRAFEVLPKGKILYISQVNDSLLLATKDKVYGKFASIGIKMATDSATMLVKPVDPSFNGRFYQGNISSYVKWNKLQLVLNIDLDTYIAGVVEAEGGVKSQPEYYKTQAVLCRTYALNHFDRHLDEGFNLCDGVHCQAFHGLVTQNQTIAKAAYATTSLVAIDTDSSLITAAFHANCGGETESSVNAWKLPKNYLRSVKDPYCQNLKQSSWLQNITWDKWKTYLLQNGFHLDDNTPRALYNQLAYKRRQFYKINSDSILMKKIRTDFNFKSSFFSVQADKSQVVIKGRGYGHGVGMCQEGAMQMALLGYNFREIIQFYYQGVAITDYRNLPVSKNKAIETLAK